MSGNPIPERLAERIRKLLALANDARGNENEASAASAKVQELLGEYNLELSQITEAEAAANPDAERVEERSTDFAREDWQVELMAEIAKNNFCLHWAETRDEALWARPQRRHVLIGRRVNVVTTREVYAYLVAAMDRLNPYEKRTKSNRSWTEGCVERLGRRLYRQRQDSEAASRAARGEGPRGNGSDLVLADVYSSEAELNEDARYGWKPGTTARNRAEAAAEMARWREENKNRPAVVPEPQPEETPAQRRKREEREAKANAKWNRAYQRQRERQEARIDPVAYQAGNEAGKAISLDKQIGDENGGPKPLLH